MSPSNPKLLAFACGMVVAAASIGAFATSIVLIRSPHGVILGADSKETWHGEEGEGAGCKIHQVDHAVFFAHGGFTYDRARQFSLDELVERAERLGSTFDTVVQEAETSVASALSTELESLSSQDPDALKYFLGLQAVSSLFFVAAENGMTRTAIRQFTPDSTPPFRITVRRIDCPGRDCPKGTGAWWMGKVRLSDLRNKHMNAEEAAEAYLNQEVKEEPDKVGPPITILRVTDDGASWVRNGGICPEVR